MNPAVLLAAAAASAIERPEEREKPMVINQAHTEIPVLPAGLFAPWLRGGVGHHRGRPGQFTKRLEKRRRANEIAKQSRKRNRK
jgi:hypothetical protein